MKTGFNQWTYFARHLEDAIAYGGEYIFDVLFETDEIPTDNWQFINHEVITPDKIVRLTKHNVKVLFDNTKLRDKIFRMNLQVDEETFNKVINDTSKQSVTGEKDEV